MNGTNNSTKSYTLTYDTNGGENGPAAEILFGGDYYAIAHITSVTPTRQGFTFAGWSFTDGGAPEVFSEDLLTLTSDNTTLFAVWAEESASVPIVGDEEEESAEPLGVVASSNNSSFDPGVVAGFSLLGIAVVLMAFVMIRRARRPRIISKTYEDSSSDPELDY